jgi:hypothetical protein
MDNFIGGMYKRVKDPATQAAYKYDFSMTPGDVDNRGLFCSSVAYEVYKEAGFQDAINPYPAQNWSTVSQTRSILLKALNMNTDRVPAPGDLEMNPQFKLVGTRIDVTKLKQERAEMAILDVFLQILDRHRDQLEKVARGIQALGNRPIDKAQLQALAAKGVLPPALAAQISNLDKIPENINIKQLAFFAFINQKMTPEIRTGLMSQITASEEQGKPLGPLQIRTLADTYEQQMIQSLVGFQQSLEKYLSTAPSCRAL